MQKRKDGIFPNICRMRYCYPPITMVNEWVPDAGLIEHRVKRLFISHRYNLSSTGRLTLELRCSRLFDYLTTRAVLRTLSSSVSRLLFVVRCVFVCSVPSALRYSMCFCVRECGSPVCFSVLY